MSNDFIVEATLRADQGKGASRRLRRLQGLVPAIIYGGDNKEPVCLSIAHNKLVHALQNEAFYSHILTIQYDGKKESAILKSLQRHPSKDEIMHADFLRVSKDHEIHVHVPVHFINEENCKGVKQGGGVISHQQIEVEVICLPADLPEFIEVDMTNVGLEEILHLSDLNLPKGVKLAALTHGDDHNLPVVSVHKPKGAKSDEEETAAE
ncbi:MAG: 50S ribosomal protein L25/general stress protein Ctc [Hahellaceae bacterium]|nr:50S ribosomal protein L25/general stress protein Ctc [Hahellaceae bacterium]MCP5168879.1 50S ribosomal protein L25/general stress protein Ctc [Hahellaceae bacterium]